MWLIRTFGVLPAYVLLFPACVSYVLFDTPSRTALRQFRTRLGLRSGPVALYRHFYAFGMNLVDRFSFLILRRSPFSYTTVGEEIIQDAVNEGNGVILLSAHLGNWEIAGNLLRDRLGVPLNVVLLDAEREALQRVYQPALDNRRFRVITITPGAPDSMVDIVARLRKNEIVCLLGDRLLGDRAIRVPFLGAPARFPFGPFAVAALTSAPIVPVFTLKTGLRHYTFVGHDPIRIPPGRSEREQAIRDGVTAYARLLEDTVRAHPLQWYNFYDFWADSTAG